jgi:uncharacterized protein (DUF885 family)/pimeloyl-ACP methyl ester carboxylesterase
MPNWSRRDPGLVVQRRHPIPKRSIAMAMHLLLSILLLAGCGLVEPTTTPVAPMATARQPSATALRITPSATSVPPTATLALPTPTPTITATPQLTSELKGWVDVGGHRLHIHCTGTGTPTVVMEAGYNDTGQTWSLVQPEVSKVARACSYDRAGLGKSDPGSEPYDSLQAVNELNTLLVNAGIEGPFVLVGHSLGGLYARLYADRYRQNVVGLVLVDSAHPDQFRQMLAALPPESPNESESVRFYRDWFTSATPDPTLDPDLFQAGSLGDLPLVVLSAPNKTRADDVPLDLNTQLNEIWLELQEELARLSSNSTLLISEKSQHFIQQDQPELVVDAILRMVSAARLGSVTAMPERTGLPSSTADIVAELAGLSIDEFFEESYRQLALRDPDSLVINGLAEEYGVANDRFTNLSDAYVRETEQLQSAVLDLLRAYDRAALSSDQQLSYDIYEWYLDDLVRGHDFKYYDYPVNPLTIWGMQNRVIDLMVNYQPVADKEDARDYVTRLAELATWVNQLLEGLKLREQAGVIPPRFIIQESIRQVEDHLQMRGSNSFDVEAIELYASFRDRLEQADGISALEKQALLDAARAEVVRAFIPAFVELRDYLVALEATASRRDGVWQLPKGDAYYAYALRHQNTADMSAEEIHELGLAEVARIQTEIRETAAAELGYPPDIGIAELDERLSADSDVLQGEALLAEYRQLIAGADRATDAFFDLRPRSELVLQEEPFGSGLAYYRAPPLDGSGPGVFYLNLDLAIAQYILPTVAYHEAIPGHHLQGALARELDLPTFRRNLDFNAFSEGWALYAEQLAWQMGLYEDDPLGNLGRLQFELSRAARLVVDTGLHAKGWTRTEAAEFFGEATGSPASPSSMDRYVILPGQGCGYTIGLLKIRELRQRAMDALGDQFDIRGFHNVVLGHGAIPLQILEQVVEDWIETELSH